MRRDRHLMTQNPSRALANCQQLTSHLRKLYHSAVWVSTKRHCRHLRIRHLSSILVTRRQLLMSNLSRRGWFSAVLLLVLLISTACTAMPAAPAESGAAGGEAASSGEAAAGEPTRLVVAQSVDVQGLEPSNVNSRAESNIFHHLYGTLYEITESGAIEPYLAESYTLSEDGKEMTFKLREGLTCHDGEPLTAEDVAYTFQRAADDANGFTGNTAGFVLDAIDYQDARVDSDLEVTIMMGRYSSPALGLDLRSLYPLQRLVRGHEPGRRGGNARSAPVPIASSSG